MYTTAVATIEYLKARMPEVKRIFALGTPSMIREFEEAGFELAACDPNDRPDALIVAFDTTLQYDRLCHAAWLAQQGLPYIATNPDRVCPTDQPTVLVDCGSLTTCIEYATGRKPDLVIGKPNPDMLSGIMYRYNLQPDEVAMCGDRIYTDVRDILLPRVIAKLPEKIKTMIDDRLILHVNPTGKFVIGGPHGDTGLTGRKIIVDTYGGKGAHGGGAFSGKDPSKVDRSAAYAARHIAKNVVAAGIADEVLVQVAYAIGVARPVSLCVNTYGTSHVALSDAEIAAKLNTIFDMRPNAIERRLKLRNPIYEETAAYGHVGRAPRTIVKEFRSKYEGNKTLTVELFTWEKLDYVERLKSEFGL